MSQNPVKSQVISSQISGAGINRVLCYSPYSYGSIHALREVTISHALKLRGAEVLHVVCDGLYRECDALWAVHHKREKNACLRCQSKVADFYFAMDMPYQWLGRYLLPAEHREAEAWVESLKIDAYLTAVYQDWPVGEWVKSSVHSHFRMSYLDMSLPQVARVFKSYLYSGLVACFGLSRLLDDYQPQVMLQYNGRMSTTRIALELALRRGIRVVTHEVGFLADSLALIENGNCKALQPLKQIWHDWGAVPLIPEELETIKTYMHLRQFGKNLGGPMFSPPPQNPEQVRQDLGLSDQGPVWVLFTSSEDEVIAAEEWGGPFARQIDWIKQTVAFVAQHPRVNLVIRAHPNTAGKKAVGDNLGQLQELLELQAQLPLNAHLVMPDAPVSSYSLMDLATLGLVYSSTVALEMACQGKTVIVAAGNLIGDLPFAKTLENVTEYDQLLTTQLDLPERAVSEEIRRLAYRHAYALFFRWTIPFPQVQYGGPLGVQMTYRSLNDLLPGRDPDLDRLARILLAGEPVCLPPAPAHLKRPEAEERAWLERHADISENGKPAPAFLDTLGHCAVTSRRFLYPVVGKAFGSLKNLIYYHNRLVKM